MRLCLLRDALRVSARCCQNPKTAAGGCQVLGVLLLLLFSVIFCFHHFHGESGVG